MKWLRLFVRFFRLLMHSMRGVWISWRVQRSTHKLPDPEVVSQWSRQALNIMGVELEIHGEMPRGPALIVANHSSWLDIPVISACTHAAFLSKAAIRHWPLIGFFAKSAGTVFIERGKGEARQVAHLMAERLHGRRQIAIFPEGKVTPMNEVARFFPRLFSAAIEANVPVVPVALAYVHEQRLDDSVSYLPGRRFMRILLHVLGRERTHAVIVFCSPIEVANKDRRTLAETSRQAIITALQTQGLLPEQSQSPAWKRPENRK